MDYLEVMLASRKLSSQEASRVIGEKLVEVLAHTRGMPAVVAEVEAAVTALTGARDLDWSRALDLTVGAAREYAVRTGQSTVYFNLGYTG